MFRPLAVLFSIAGYAIGVAALVYLILFITDLVVPVTINHASPLAPALPGAAAAAWDLALVALWGLQHTVMASPKFKAAWTKIIPAAIERSTYLIAVAIMTAGLIALWVPLPGVIWDVSAGLPGTVLLGVYFLGWGIVLFSTFLINHFHLFGLQQAWRMATNTPSKQESFRTPVLYKLVRHPMMTGMLIAFWAAPELTVGRLVFNLAMTAYILIGISYEEKTLVADLGEDYDAYRRSTPSLIPGLGVAKK